jgi:hypothetical protein
MLCRVHPFAIRVADRDLDDLADRLARTRWAAELPPGWDRGTDPVYLRRMVQQWQDGFDWRAQEREINRFAQFMADVDDV